MLKYKFHNLCAAFYCVIRDAATAARVIVLRLYFLASVDRRRKKKTLN